MYILKIQTTRWLRTKINRKEIITFFSFKESSFSLKYLNQIWKISKCKWNKANFLFIYIYIRMNYWEKVNSMCENK